MDVMRCRYRNLKKSAIIIQKKKRVLDIQSSYNASQKTSNLFETYQKSSSRYKFSVARIAKVL